jgi:NAD-dependent deacetylase
MECYRVESANGLIRKFLASGELPRCAECGGAMKPDVILFGEQLPADVVNAALAHVNSADLMLIAGSSLEVMPVSQLPLRIHRQGGCLIVVNEMATYVDDAADVVIHDDIARVLPRIAEACLA